MSALQILPQISRLFSASTNRVLSYIAILSVLCFLAVANMTQGHPFHKYSRSLELLLTSPLTPQPHMNLASYFKSTANELKKTNEVLITKDLLQKEKTPSVLGASQDITNTIQTWESEPKELQKKLIYWQQVLRMHSDYRDAYIQAAYIAHMLGDITLSMDYWQKAIDIDPLVASY